MQMTPFQAMQASSWRRARPMAPVVSPTSPSSNGQTSTQARQNVQPPRSKERQDMPRSTWSSGCSPMSPSLQAARQGCWQYSHGFSDCKATQGQAGREGRGPRARTQRWTPSLPSRVRNRPRRRLRRAQSTAPPCPECPLTSGCSPPGAAHRPAAHGTGCSCSGHR
jgi:hypothetical protein